MRTLVGHGWKLPVFFDQQRSATSQVDLSHPVKQTKTKRSAFITSLMKNNPSKAMWQQNEGTSGQQLQRQLTCNKVLHSVSHSSHVFRHIIWSIKGLICKKSASRVAKCAYYLTADRPHRNLPDWRREMQYRGDLQRLETGLWLRGREDTTRRGKKAFWKCFDPLGHRKQKKRFIFVSLCPC